jgi:hypothetical protein
MFFSFAGKVRRRLRLMQPTPFRARKDGEGSGNSRGQLPSLKLYAARQNGLSCRKIAKSNGARLLTEFRFLVVVLVVDRPPIERSYPRFHAYLVSPLRPFHPDASKSGDGGHGPRTERMCHLATRAVGTSTSCLNTGGLNGSRCRRIISTIVPTGERRARYRAPTRCCCQRQSDAVEVCIGQARGGRVGSGPKR